MLKNAGTQRSKDILNADSWNYYEQDKHKVKNKNEKKIVRPSNINELCEY